MEIRTYVRVLQGQYRTGQRGVAGRILLNWILGFCEYHNTYIRSQMVKNFLTGWNVSFSVKKALLLLGFCGITKKADMRGFELCVTWSLFSVSVTMVMCWKLVNQMTKVPKYFGLVISGSLYGLMIYLNPTRVGSSHSTQTPCGRVQVYRSVRGFCFLPNRSWWWWKHQKTDVTAIQDVNV
jgi:hypothetical protein